MKTSRTQLRPQADDHPDEVVVPALFGDPSDTTMPTTGDTAEASSPQVPSSQVQDSHHQVPTGVTAEVPSSDPTEFVSVT